MTAWGWEGGAVVLRFGSLNLVCGTIIGRVIRSIQLYMCGLMFRPTYKAYTCSSW